MLTGLGCAACCQKGDLLVVSGAQLWAAFLGAPFCPRSPSTDRCADGRRLELLQAAQLVLFPAPALLEGDLLFLRAQLASLAPAPGKVQCGSPCCCPLAQIVTGRLALATPPPGAAGIPQGATAGPGCAFLRAGRPRCLSTPRHGLRLAPDPEAPLGWHALAAQTAPGLCCGWSCGFLCLLRGGEGEAEVGVVAEAVRHPPCC